MAKNIRPKDFLSGQSEYVLVDVRTTEEWGEYHEGAAKHIPLDELDFRANELPRQKLAVICRSGGRSVAACDILSSFGYEAHNVLGGMAALLIAKKQSGMISASEYETLAGLI